jgi:hypothetical protein
MRTHTVVKATAAAAVVVAVFTLGACGGGGHQSDSRRVGTDPADAAAYGQVVTAVTGADVALCRPADAPARLDYIPLPALTVSDTDTASYRRYLNGRLYEFGPCQLAPGHRNELHVYRFPDGAVRDSALRDVAQLGTHPTATFAFRDVYALEIWSPEPSLDSPIGQAAAEVHSALGRLPQSHHLDLPLSDAS